MNKNHDVRFVRSGRGAAQCVPDPLYPKGKQVDCSNGRMACYVNLPYPAPECGYFAVICKTCKASVVVTAAGRADDPTVLTMPCAIDTATAGNA